MDIDKKQLEQKAFQNIVEFVNHKGNHNFVLTSVDNGIMIENEHFKYQLLKNSRDVFDDTYGLKIFSDNKEYDFYERPNRSTYDELYIKLADMLW